MDEDTVPMEPCSRAVLLLADGGHSCASQFRFLIFVVVQQLRGMWVLLRLVPMLQCFAQCFLFKSESRLISWTTQSLNENRQKNLPLFTGKHLHFSMDSFVTFAGLRDGKGDCFSFLLQSGNCGANQKVHLSFPFNPFICIATAEKLFHLNRVHKKTALYFSIYFQSNLLWPRSMIWMQVTSISRRCVHRHTFAHPPVLSAWHDLLSNHPSCTPSATSESSGMESTQNPTNQVMRIVPPPSTPTRCWESNLLEQTGDLSEHPEPIGVSVLIIVH